MKVLELNKNLFCFLDSTGASCERRVGGCSDPPSIPNGSVKTFKSYALYTCNSGYVTIGILFRKCKNGKWKGVPPTCQSTGESFTVQVLHEILSLVAKMAKKYTKMYIITHMKRQCTAH